MAFREQLNKVAEEENAAELKLGAELQNAAALMNSEVIVILEKRKEEIMKDLPDEEDKESLLPEVLNKTLAYVNRFNTYKGMQSARDVRKTLAARQLEPFEIAALANLTPGDADEAKTLVPSLTSRFDDEEIEAMIEELAQYRQLAA